MAIKYKWLAGRLREQLPDYTANGIHRLPTEAAISQRYKVSRQTVRQALSVLEQEGLIEKRQGSGSYITGRSRSRMAESTAMGMESFRAQEKSTISTASILVTFRVRR